MVKAGIGKTPNLWDQPLCIGEATFIWSFQKFIKEKGRKNLIREALILGTIVNWLSKIYYCF